MASVNGVRNRVKGPHTRARWYEVAVCWQAEGGEPEALARFRAEGDAYIWATELAASSAYMHEVIIR